MSDKLVQTTFNVTFIVGLILLAIQDSRTRRISNLGFVFMLGVSILYVIWLPVSAIVWQLAGLLPALILLGAYFINDGAGIGGGDVKLIAAMGLYLGLGRSALALLIAAAGGLAYGGIMRLIRQPGLSKAIVFAPWLAVGGVFSLLLG